ncbi:MAG: YggT family protein [Chloroflexota bacterium]|nr:YggT family protein [Chloroflexota bacterium]
MTDIVISFIHILSLVLIIAIIVRALMSWIMPNDASGLTRVLLDITDPVLRPIRRVLPPVGGIDFSPLLALVLIQLVSQVLTQLLVNVG